ncbi:uncharacterized protein E5676_scaffold120G002660 [Cucumis melo var. makuwa]|uniref:Gypsy-like retrotransposase n=1 Tax=Cucumis melo var. makuwa TaxID=1194695 RepID=A0A5A7UMH1_CUCMM|nr:uncharacterized protein E6C27_scaffold186G001420 [Cucumis melo var. makuwa]TYK29124.1 uncharacterized protein E5676_scaffold120G002660 [Cucumis melo var. makuwa]
MSIDFSDEDLLLGFKLHNRPLYVSGYVREQRVDRILVDNGSAVNIMPKSTMRQLGILMEELSNSKLVIQGFNQGSQRVIGMIPLELIIGDLKASALFHVIDSRTTYKLLLGRPWIHGNGVVTSTLHQCFKFYQDGVKKVETDSNPFSEAESHFADAKFYLKNDSSRKAVRKKGESPFVESPQGLKVGDIEVLKESFTTPLTKITKQEIKIDLTEASLPQRRTKDGFDPKAYKLMAKAGYDFTTHIEFRRLKIHEQLKLSSTKKKLLREGHAIPMSRKGLGYKSPEPIRITIKGKEKVVDNNHITVKEVDSMEEKEGDSQRTSAFDRISPHVTRAPVFERLSMTEAERKDHQSTSNVDQRSAFQRLTITFKEEKGICQASITTKPSAFERLSITKKKNAQTPRAPIINHLRDGGLHVQTDSSIDTKKKESTSRVSVGRRIKHINVDSRHGSLKVKRHDVILTNPEKEDSEQGEGEISCHHITILEELEIETLEEDAEDAPQSLEDGG